jgi:hypothetical protein
MRIVNPTQCSRASVTPLTRSPSLSFMTPLTLSDQTLASATPFVYVHHPLPSRRRWPLWRVLSYPSKRSAHIKLLRWSKMHRWCMSRWSFTASYRESLVALGRRRARSPRHTPRDHLGHRDGEDDDHASGQWHDTMRVKQLVLCLGRGSQSTGGHGTVW